MGDNTRKPSFNKASIVYIPQDFWYAYSDDSEKNLSSLFSGCLSLLSIGESGLIAVNNLRQISNMFNENRRLPNPYGIFNGVDLSNILESDIGNQYNNSIFTNCPFVGLDVLDTSLIGLSGRIYPMMFMNAGGAGPDSTTYFPRNKINVVIDASITSIGVYAFRDFGGTNNANIDWFECKGTTPPVLDSNSYYGHAFANTGTVPIYVPDSAVAAYKSADVWSELADRIFAVSERS
jgi:hypothetical protein